MLVNLLLQNYPFQNLKSLFPLYDTESVNLTLAAITRNAKMQMMKLKIYSSC